MPTANIGWRRLEESLEEGYWPQRAYDGTDDDDDEISNLFLI